MGYCIIGQLDKRAATDGTMQGQFPLHFPLIPFCRQDSSSWHHERNPRIFTGRGFLPGFFKIHNSFTGTCVVLPEITRESGTRIRYFI
jgi:hypothetical protein